MNIPPPNLEVITSTMVDDQGEMLSLRCTPVGFLGDVITLTFTKAPGEPLSGSCIRFSHSSMRDPSVSEIVAAERFVEAYSFLIDTASWIISQRASGVGIYRIESAIQSLQTQHREAA